MTLREFADKLRYRTFTDTAEVLTEQEKDFCKEQGWALLYPEDRLDLQVNAEGGIEDWEELDGEEAIYITCTLPERGYFICRESQFRAQSYDIMPLPHGQLFGVRVELDELRRGYVLRCAVPHERISLTAQSVHGEQKVSGMLIDLNTLHTANLE
jgi:hypothetical protein